MTLTQIKPAGLSKPVDLADNEKIRLGTGNDLQIYHDGSNSYIQDTDQGNLFIEASAVLIRKNGTTENIAKFIQDGAVELYHDNSKKFETLTNGVQVTGNTVIDGTGTQTTSVIVKNGTDTDGTRLGHSSNSDRGFIQVTESGADFGIQVGGANTSNMRLELFGDSTTASRICLGTEEMITAAPNGAVSLYYDNSKKFETQSTGAKVTGQLNFDDGSSTANTNGIGFGSSQDCRVFHDGSSFQIRNVTGPVTCITPSFFRLAADSSNDTMLKAIQDGAVELYYDNSMKVATQSAGVTMEQSLYMANSNASIFWGTSGGYGAQHGIGTAQLANYHVSGTGVGDMVIAAKNQKNILFATAPNNSGGIDASGGQWRMRINTDTTIDISSRIHAQSGINFGTDSAAANALDDYEEGTFSPAIGGASNINTYNVSGTGKYTKIGNKVDVHMTWSNIDISNSASGNVMIKSLPFTSSTHQYTTTTDHYLYNVGFETGRIQSWYVDYSATTMQGIESRPDNSWQGWSVGNFTASGTYLRVHLSYLSA